MSANEDARQDWPEGNAAVAAFDYLTARVAKLESRLATIEATAREIAVAECAKVRSRLAKVEGLLPEITHLRRTIRDAYDQADQPCPRCADRYEELIETAADLGRAVTELRTIREAYEAVGRVEEEAPGGTWPLLSEELDMRQRAEAVLSPDSHAPRASPEELAAWVLKLLAKPDPTTPDSPEPELPEAVEYVSLWSSGLRVFSSTPMESGTPGLLKSDPLYSESTVRDLIGRVRVAVMSAEHWQRETEAARERAEKAERERDDWKHVSGKRLRHMGEQQERIRELEAERDLLREAVTRTEGVVRAFPADGQMTIHVRELHKLIGSAWLEGVEKGRALVPKEGGEAESVEGEVEDWKQWLFEQFRDIPMYGPDGDGFWLVRRADVISTIGDRIPVRITRLPTTGGDDGEE